MNTRILAVAAACSLALAGVAGAHCGNCPGDKAKADGDAAAAKAADCKKECVAKAGEAKPCCAEMAAGKEETPAVVNTKALAALINAKAVAVVLDARTGKFDDGRRIPGAKSLTAAATAEDAAKLIPAKDSLVVTYCANLKCPASGKLAAHLKGLGYTNVVEYPAGIDGWVEAGQKVEAPAK